MKWSVLPKSFKRNINIMKEMGVTSYCPGNDIQENELPPCFITFDDGHKSNLEAAEILAWNGLSACFYVVKDYSLNNSAYLTSKDIKEISKMGHVIGVHGKYHRWWTDFGNDQLISDLKETKNWIEDLTGVGVNTCSAVGGKINKRVISCIRERIPDLKYIRTSRWGFNMDDDLLLNSIGITTHLTGNEFKNILELNRWYYSFGQAKYSIKELIKPFYHSLIRK